MLIRMRFGWRRPKPPSKASQELFGTVLRPRRRGLQGYFVSVAIHCLLIIGLFRIGEWMPESDTPWFDRSASITYLRGGVARYGVLYLPAARTTRELDNSPGSARRPGIQLLQPGTKSAPRRQLARMPITLPPDIRFAWVPGLENPWLDRYLRAATEKIPEPASAPKNGSDDKLGPAPKSGIQLLDLATVPPKREFAATAIIAPPDLRAASGKRIFQPPTATPSQNKSLAMALPPEIPPRRNPEEQALPESGMLKLATGQMLNGSPVKPPEPAGSSPSPGRATSASAREHEPMEHTPIGLAPDPGRPRAVPALLPLPPAVEGEVRLVHPADGQFDVVLLQSAPDSALEVLKGGPVYSVYLDVGTRKEWMLHFCAREPSVEITEHLVRIGAVEPIAAPYPKFTVVPPSLVAGAGRGPTAISGVIDEDGHFGHLDALEEDDRGVLKHLMSTFENWLFQPAKRKGVPLAVQVVLVIPAADE